MPKKSKTPTAEDAYQIGSYSYLRLGSASSSSGSSSVASSRSDVRLDSQRTQASSSAVGGTKVKQVTTTEDDDRRDSAEMSTLTLLEGAADDYCEEDEEDETRSFLQSPHVMKASLNRKLLAYINSTDEIAKMTNSQNRQLRNNRVHINARTGEPIPVQMLSKREVVGRKPRFDLEAQQLRLMRRDSRLSCATADYFAARNRTQQLVADLERSLADEPTATGADDDQDEDEEYEVHSNNDNDDVSASGDRQPEQPSLKAFLRDATVKLITCLRGRDELAYDEELVPAAKNGGDSATIPSQHEDLFPSKRPFVLNTKQTMNIIKRNIRQSRATKIRSCMRLPRMSEEDQQEIDEILRTGELKVAEPSAEARNPYTLMMAERERLKVLNTNLASDAVGRPAVPNRVRFADQMKTTQSPPATRSQTAGTLRAVRPGQHTSRPQIATANRMRMAGAGEEEDVQPKDRAANVIDEATFKNFRSLTVANLTTQKSDPGDAAAGGFFPPFQPPQITMKRVQFPDAQTVGTNAAANGRRMDAEFLAKFKSLNVEDLANSHLGRQRQEGERFAPFQAPQIAATQRVRFAAEPSTSATIEADEEAVRFLDEFDFNN